MDDDYGVRKAFKKIFIPGNKIKAIEKAVEIFDGKASRPRASKIDFELVEAEKGDVGLKYVEKAIKQGEPFDVAFIDLRMPGLDGIQTAKHLLEMDDKVLITIITGFAGPDTPKKVFEETGREDILLVPKPFQPADIRKIALYARILRKFDHAIEKYRIVPEAGSKGLKKRLSRAQGAIGLISSVSNTPSIESTDSEKAPCNRARIDLPDKSHVYVYGAGNGFAYESTGPDAVAVCPYCELGVGLRIPRKKWMRVIPGSRYYLCNRCGQKFLKIIH
ncbi:MAG: response regulator [Deltaproteobacteria bacterium]|nr:response regulator [Deltaproteobacteria bacterium]